MFSIIIPLYNKADHIVKAVRSVLNQSYHEFELIIVNDGSTDNSLGIIEQYLESQQKSGNSSVLEHVRVITQSNSGVAVARNTGVNAAKYDYIAFMDADDWWHKHYLANMKELIESYPDAKIFSSGYYLVKNERQYKADIGVNELFKRGYINYCETYVKTFYMPVWTGATVISKQTFEEFGGFRPALRLGEDFDLWLRVALKYKIAFLNEPLAYYNQMVDQEYKATAQNRIYKPEEHYIFNLGYLESEERQNDSLKKLLDMLRLYVLKPYYLNAATRRNAIAELAKVNWEKQSIKERLWYRSPVWLLKLEHRLLQLGSAIKKSFQ